MKGISKLYRSSRRAYDFFKDNKHFDQMLIHGSHLIVANDINDLTGICFPDFETRGGQVCVRYELGCVVAGSASDGLEALDRGLANDHCLILPRTTPSKHTLDCFIEDGKASDWLIQTMGEDMAHLTMEASKALDLIENRDTRFGKYLRAYSEAWVERNICEPLRKLVR